MSKRGASSELNHENWNVEDEAEDAGTFQVAAQSELQARKILRPKRRVAQSEPPSNPFQLFGGFESFTQPSTDNPVVSTMNTPKAVSTETKSKENPQPDDSQHLKNHNGTLFEEQNRSAELSSGDPVINSSNRHSLLDSESGSVQNKIHNSVSESEDRSNRKTLSEALDLPDFVDQSDDEAEPSRDAEVESDLDSNNPSSE